MSKWLEMMEKLEGKLDMIEKIIENLKAGEIWVEKGEKDKKEESGENK